MSPQNRKVLYFMLMYGSITPLEALIKLGIMRLGARIWDLKKEGYIIRKDTVKVHTRAGMTCVAKYSLAKENVKSSRKC